MQAAPTTIVYTSQPMPQQPMAVGYAIPVTMSAPMYGEHPASMNCPNCHQHIVTRTMKKSGLVTWLACGGLAFVGCTLGCCLIPFCIDAGKDTHHYCPSCSTYLGVHKML